MGRLDGKVAAITGGASGIGEATARLFVEEGARVAIADMDAERGRMVADEIKAAGGEVIFVEAHMEREADAIDFIRRTVEQYGRLDILVNNAGMRLYQTVVEASEESWDAILGVNLKGYAFCAKAAIPEMRKTGGGSIVNIASQRAFIAGGNMVQYDATKAAVTGLDAWHGLRPCGRGHPGQRRLPRADFHALSCPSSGRRGQDRGGVPRRIRARHDAQTSWDPARGGKLYSVPGLG